MPIPAILSRIFDFHKEVKYLYESASYFGRLSKAVTPPLLGFEDGLKLLKAGA